MSERVILEEAGVKVTETHFEVPGARYPLREIRSVDRERVPPAATGPVLMVVCGVLSLLAVAGDSPVVGGLLGVALLAGAAGWWWRKQPTFALRLQTAAGEVTPFESRDEQIVNRIAVALTSGASAASPPVRAPEESTR
jgi:hypothetical protein